MRFEQWDFKKGSEYRGLLVNCGFIEGNMPKQVPHTGSLKWHSIRSKQLSAGEVRELQEHIICTVNKQFLFIWAN